MVSKTVEGKRKPESFGAGFKHCIIVGAGPGVSSAIAHKFGSNGLRVSLVARDAEKLRCLSQRLRDAGITAAWEQADAGNAAELDHALDALVSRQGPCDVLIYNAAVLSPGLPLEVATEDISTELAVNILGAHRAVRKLAPAMIKQGAGAICLRGEDCH